MVLGHRLQPVDATVFHRQRAQVHVVTRGRHNRAVYGVCFEKLSLPLCRDESRPEPHRLAHDAARHVNAHFGADVCAVSRIRLIHRTEDVIV